MTVLTESATDVLSHVAIRARSQNVLLATCFDDDVYKGFEALQVGGRVDGWDGVNIEGSRRESLMSSANPPNCPRHTHTSNHTFNPNHPSATHQGHPVSVDVTASGDVRLRQLDAAEAAAASKSAKGE